MKILFLNYCFLFLFMISSLMGESLIRGYIRDRISLQPIDQVNIQLADTYRGCVSDPKGSFELRVDNRWNYQLKLSHIAYRDTLIHGRGEFILIELTPSSINLDSVEVTANRVTSPQPFSYLIDCKIQNRMPFVFNSIYHTLKILPGVTANNEFINRYNVRGGNYDENLLEINGVEINPFITTRKSVYENIGLVNPYLVKDYTLHTGGMGPACNDKLSSMAEIIYQDSSTQRITGNAHLSMMDAALSLNLQHSPSLHSLHGVRYSRLNYFFKSYEIKGDYSPEVFDLQNILNWRISSRWSIQLISIVYRNRFWLLPYSKLNRLSSGDLFYFDYEGNEQSSFYSLVHALKADYRVSSRSRLRQILQFNDNRESVTNHVRTDLFEVSREYPYGPYGDYTETEYLIQDADDRIREEFTSRVLSYRADLTLRDRHHWGCQLAYSDVQDTVSEYHRVHDVKTDSTATFAYHSRYRTDFYKPSFYWREDIRLSSALECQLGLRYYYFSINREHMVMPRLKLIYVFNSISRIYFNLGLYAQPPEFKQAGLTYDPEIHRNLSSQKSLELMGGYRFLDGHRRIIKVELFWKDLDHVIPYYPNDLQLVYDPRHIARGYAAGLDFYMGGNLVQDLYSWISYSYLLSKINIPNDGLGYLPRPTEQHHTLVFFAQDRLLYYPLWKTSLRFILGSGYPEYYPELNGDTIEFKKAGKYPFYFRLDVGIMRDIPLSGNRQVVISLQYLNMFNRQNTFRRDYRLEWGILTLPLNYHTMPRTINLTLDYEF